MGHRLLLGLGAIAVVVALLWFAGVGEWLGLTTADLEGAGGGAELLGSTADATGGAGAAAQGEGDAASRQPSLFGQSRLARVGLGSIRGRVMDFDAGKPVADALLVLGGTANEGVSTTARGRTGANGRFLLPEVRAGDAYRLQVSAEGHPERLLDAVVVAAGSEVELGDIWLGERGILEGRVVDADGQGIPGAAVRMHHAAGSAMHFLRDMGEWHATFDRDSPPLAMVQSNEEGQFRIADIEPGRITLVVRATGFGQAMTDVMMTPTGVAGGTLVVMLDARAPLRGIVVDGAGRGVGRARVAVFQPNDFTAMMVGRAFVETSPNGEFEVPAPPTLEGARVIAAAEGHATVGHWIQPGETEPRVVLAGGTELLVRLTIEGGRASPAGAAVSIFITDAEPYTSESSASGLTDARGEVRLAARPGKLSSVFVRHLEAGSGLYAPELRELFQDAAVRGPDELTLVSGENTLELVLGQGQVIVGHVRDGGGGPLAGVRVAAEGFMVGGESVTSAADGSYVVRTMGHTYQVVATLPGYVQQARDLMEWRSDREEKRDAEGRLVIDLVMEQAGVLGGRVVDEAGRPVVGAQVMLEGHGTDDLFGVKSGTTTTNATGRYLLDGVEPGSAVEATASCPGYVSATSAGVEVKAGAAAEVPDIVLGRGFTLRVKVAGPHGRPVAGAHVRMEVDRTDGVFAARTTGARGTVEFLAVPAGVITLSVTAMGTAGARHVLELGAAKAAVADEHVVSLRAATSLEGRVVDENGTALAGAWVKAGRVEAGFVEVESKNGVVLVYPVPGGAERPRPGPIDDWMPIRAMRTDAEGRFRFADLPRGELPLKFTHDGHTPLELAWSGRGDAGDFRIVARSSAATARMAEIDEEHAVARREYMKGGNPEAQRAASERMAVLSEERSRLEEGR